MWQFSLSVSSKSCAKSVCLPHTHHLISSVRSENFSRCVVSLIATCAIHTAGLTPMFSLAVAPSLRSSSSVSRQRNNCKCILQSSSQTESYIFLMSSRAEKTPWLNLKCTAQMLFTASGTFNRKWFKLWPLNFLLAFQTSLTGFYLSERAIIFSQPSLLLTLLHPTWNHVITEKNNAVLVIVELLFSCSLL